MIAHHRIPFGEEYLAASLTLPSAGPAPVSCMVTGPGFGGVKEMLIPAFADALAGAGIANLAIDFLGFGESSGEPRQHVDPAAQARQMAAALDWASARPEIDETRLGVWGTSFSGGHALLLAAEYPRLRCVVAIVPFIAAPAESAPEALRAAVAADAVARSAGKPGATIPAVGRPGDVAIMTGDGAWEWSEAVTAGAPTWRNEITLASIPEVMAYRPAASAARIAVPVRAILATDDTITPAAMVREALAAVPELDVVEFPESHFELFGPDKHLDDVIALTAGWAVQHLA